MDLTTIVKNEFTLQNLISVSRPLIAYTGLEYVDEPIYQSGIIATAFLTDAVDGLLARRFGKSKFGAYVDIFSDRALEMVTMWTFAKEGSISYIIPSIFTTKGLITDTTRILRDRKKGDFNNPLNYGNNGRRIERFSYAVVKGTYLSGVPIFSSIAKDIMGTATTIFGLYRGIKSFKN